MGHLLAPHPLLAKRKLATFVAICPKKAVFVARGARSVGRSSSERVPAHENFSKSLKLSVRLSAARNTPRPEKRRGRNGSLYFPADALDFLGDAGNYAISLLVVGMALRYRATAALAKGGTMALFGLWVLGIPSGANGKI
jgi:hypothetical protein